MLSRNMRTEPRTIRAPLLLESIDTDRRRHARQSAANPGDLEGLERTRAAHARGGKNREAAETLKQVTAIKGEKSAPQRGRVKARAVRKRMKQPIEPGPPPHRRNPGDRDDQDRALLHRAAPHITRVMDSWDRRNGPYPDDPKQVHEKGAKALHHLHRLADKHGVAPHFYFPEHDPDDSDVHTDAGLMAHVYKAHSHEEGEGDHGEHEHTGVARFHKKEHAEGFQGAMGDRHNLRHYNPRSRHNVHSKWFDGDVQLVKSKTRHGGTTWDVHYSAGRYDPDDQY